MKKFVVIIISILFLNISLSAQNSDFVIVRAGTKVLDYFPFQERYQYPQFIDGQIIFKSGNISTAKLNYNILLGEIVFIQSHDTLAISRKKDVRNIVIARDTFFYDNGYLQLIHSGNIRVGLKHYVKIKDVLKKGAFGTTARGVSIDSYNSIASSGNLYDLVPNEDLELQKMKEYFISTPTSGFVQFRKKFVLQLFPEKSDAIKEYLKSNKIDFDSEKDLLRFADYLQKF
jgi:hypothetical protein